MPDMIALFSLGVISGFSVCAFACFSYLGPYLFCTGQGFKDGLIGTLLYLGGKTVMYAVFGGVATFSKSLLSTAMVSSGRIIMGSTLLLIALLVPFQQQGRCGAGTRQISLLGLGISTSLIPCPIMASVLVIAAQQDAILKGVFCGLSFGLGLMVSPLLIAGGGIAFVTAGLRVEIQHFMPILKGVAMLILATFGIQILVQ
ncbi:sulfite exporter TauE/SafE family protein [bacterium]|nr:sulfite exporter TauE/SafE family protein [bacterium]